MKVDAYLPALGPASATPYAIDMAARGYDGVMVAEMRHDPFLVAAAVAPAFGSGSIGTAVAIAFARSPMTLAYSAWDLAAMTDGRFVLGLGTQVRAHVVHRFSMPWSAPVGRLREYIEALRAIWRSWQTGETLRFRGEHYRFALMTPMFNPGPIDHPGIPIAIAGVGTGLSRLAGEVADGFHIHPFHTQGYLRDVVEPAIAEGAQASGRSPASVVRFCSVMVGTGSTQAEVDAARDRLRSQISFYASTPTYRGVLEHRGWDIGERLTAMSKRGEWEAMASLITDEIVDEIAVVAPFDDLAARIRVRYDGHLDRVGLYPAGPLGLSAAEERDVVAALRI